MTRELYIQLMIGLPVVGLVIACYGAASMWRFLTANVAIEQPSQLESLKRMVAVQMVLALAQIGVLATPLLLFFVGRFTGHLGQLSDILYLLIPSLFVLAAGLGGKLLEKRVKTMRVSDELLAEFDHIVDVWLKRALPDWW